MRAKLYEGRRIRYSLDEGYRKKQIEASVASYNKRVNNDSAYKDARNKASRDRKRERYHTDDEYRTAELLRGHNRRERATGDFSAAQWAASCEAFDFKCAYCNAEANLTMDHVIPILCGGKTTASNIIPACKSCNSSKGANDMIEWYTAQPFYDKDRLEAILKYLRKVGDA